jgi:hypothetical protein
MVQTSSGALTDFSLWVFVKMEKSEDGMTITIHTSERIRLIEAGTKASTWKADEMLTFYAIYFKFSWMQRVEGNCGGDGGSNSRDGKNAKFLSRIIQR